MSEWTRLFCGEDRLCLVLIECYADPTIAISSTA